MARSENFQAPLITRVSRKESREYHYRSRILAGRRSQVDRAPEDRGFL